MNSESPHKLEYAGAKPLDGPRRTSRLAAIALLLTIASTYVMLSGDLHVAVRERLNAAGYVREAGYRGTEIILTVPVAASLTISSIAHWRIKRRGSGLRGAPLAFTALVLSTLDSLFSIYSLFWVYTLSFF
jgi:hypothetical protein